MSEQRNDFELLRDFARHSDQQAFAALVRRHLDLVYATALRKTTDAAAAQEISQNVFAALARKAWQFASDDSLPAWLYKTALLESRHWLRGELRRRRREQEAANLGTTMNTPDEQPALRALIPLLDEALLSLREKERTALLLRFYESQSLREVGTSLGVGEDAAQKRVGSALEKLARFFQRRGFRTATVAIAAAALQTTATSTSAATATTVATAALHGAPSLAGGLAWLARLASLSKPQLAALCLVTMALPVAWQWNASLATARRAAEARAALESVRSERITVESEIDRLTRSAEGLKGSLANAATIEAQNADAAQKLELWKTRIRSELMAADYHWSDDSPFVRIPKAVVPRLGAGMSIQPPGVIAPEARELLGLSPEERATVEERLHNYFGNIDRLIENGMIETNQSVVHQGRPPAGAVASTIYYVPALGDEAKASAGNLEEELKSVLGDQRWPWWQAQWDSHGTHTLRRILDIDSDQEAQEVSIWINTNSSGALTVGYHWATSNSAFGTDGAALAAMLPGANPPDGRSPIQDVECNNLPGPVTSRMLAWLQEQAQTRLGQEAKR
jgi:RNA polymerase sigma factor (sigma-70 family)